MARVLDTPSNCQNINTHGSASPAAAAPQPPRAPDYGCRVRARQSLGRRDPRSASGRTNLHDRAWPAARPRAQGHLRHEQDGRRYVYLPSTSRQKAGASSIAHVVKTFFAARPPTRWPPCSAPKEAGSVTPSSHASQTSWRRLDGDCRSDYQAGAGAGHGGRNHRSDEPLQRAARHAVWAGAILATLALPLLSVTLPTIDVPAPFTIVHQPRAPPDTRHLTPISSHEPSRPHGLALLDGSTVMHSGRGSNAAACPVDHRRPGLRRAPHHCRVPAARHRAPCAAVPERITRQSPAER